MKQAIRIHIENVNWIMSISSIFLISQIQNAESEFQELEVNFQGSKSVRISVEAQRMLIKTSEIPSDG